MNDAALIYIINNHDKKTHFSYKHYLYPNTQARYFLHKLSLNQQITYCMRTHFPQHSQPLVEGFIRSQMKLICSYHAINFEEQYHLHNQEIIRLCKVAAAPIHKGGMGLGCMKSVHLAAFPASMVAVSAYLAKAYPSWIQIQVNNEGHEVRVMEDLEPFTRGSTSDTRCCNHRSCW